MSDFNSGLIEHIRDNGGRVTEGPFAGRQLLVLTTTGAKSGESRETPLVYTRDGHDIVIVASMGGANSHPAWYHNILANPRVTIEVDGARIEAKARIADGDERRRLYDQHADLHQSFTGYESKTSRVIPVVVVQRVTATAVA